MTQQEAAAITNLALSLSVAMSKTTDADMRTKLEAMNQILIGALKAAAPTEEMKG